MNYQDRKCRGCDQPYQAHGDNELCPLPIDGVRPTTDIVYFDPWTDEPKEDAEMNDQDYIRKAVELADFFQCDNVNDRFFHEFGPEIEDFISTFWDNPEQYFLDALAAQLVRQVDVVGRYYVEADKWSTRVMELVPLRSDCEILMSEGDDRTMNAIKVIMDSGVLTEEAK